MTLPTDKKLQEGLNAREERRVIAMYEMFQSSNAERRAATA